MEKGEEWSHSYGGPTQGKNDLIIMGDLPRKKKDGLIMKGDLSKWKRGLIIMGDLPR